MSTLITQLLESIAVYLENLVSKGYTSTKGITIDTSKRGTSVSTGLSRKDKTKIDKHLRFVGVVFQTLKPHLDETAQRELHRLIDANAYTSFYTVATKLLQAVKPRNEREAAAIEMVTKECVNYLKSKQMREEVAQIEEQSPQLNVQLLDISLLITSKRTKVEKLLQEESLTQAKRYLRELEKWANLTIYDGIDSLTNSLQVTLQKHRTVLTHLSKAGRNKDAEAIKREKHEIGAILSNLKVLSFLSSSAGSWENLGSAMEIAKTKLESAVEKANYQGYDQIRALQALYESVIPQLEAMKTKHHNAADKLESLKLDAGGTLRDLLSSQDGKGGSKFNEITADEMGILLRDLGVGNLASINLPGAEDIDAFGKKVFNSTHWFIELVKESYFTSLEKQAKAWVRIRVALNSLRILDLSALLTRAVYNASIPDYNQLVSFVTQVDLNERVSEIHKQYKSLIKFGATQETAKRLVCLWLEAKGLFNDTPLNIPAILKRLATNNATQPITLFYVGCLRHSYAGGKHSIKVQLREAEWVVEFQKVTKLFEHYRIPYKALVCLSDLEITYTKIYEIGHPNRIAAEEYSARLGKACGYETKLLIQYLEEKGVMSLFDNFYSLFMERLQEAYQYPQSQAWAGWHFQSLQEKVESEWLSLASKQADVHRSESRTWAFRVIAKAMASGVVLSALDEIEPIIVFVTGRQPSSEIEVRGSKAVGGKSVGYIFLRIPQNQQLNQSENEEG